MEGASGNQLWERICTGIVDVLGENPSTRAGARGVFSWDTHTHHQMVNTENRLIIFFVAKDGKVLNSQ